MVPNRNHHSQVLVEGHADKSARQKVPVHTRWTAKNPDKSFWDTFPLSRWKLTAASCNTSRHANCRTIDCWTCRLKCGNSFEPARWPRCKTIGHSKFASHQLDTPRDAYKLQPYARLRRHHKNQEKRWLRSEWFVCVVKAGYTTSTFRFAWLEQPVTTNKFGRRIFIATLSGKRYPVASVEIYQTIRQAILLTSSLNFFPVCMWESCWVVFLLQSTWCWLIGLVYCVNQRHWWNSSFQAALSLF